MTFNRTSNSFFFTKKKVCIHFIIYTCRAAPRIFLWGGGFDEDYFWDGAGATKKLRKPIKMCLYSFSYVFYDLYHLFGEVGFNPPLIPPPGYCLICVGQSITSANEYYFCKRSKNYDWYPIINASLLRIIDYDNGSVIAQITCFFQPLFALIIVSRSFVWASLSLGYSRIPCIFCYCDTACRE